MKTPRSVPLARPCTDDAASDSLSRAITPTVDPPHEYSIVLARTFGYWFVVPGVKVGWRPTSVMAKKAAERARDE